MQIHVLKHNAKCHMHIIILCYKEANSGACMMVLFASPILEMETESYK